MSALLPDLIDTHCHLTSVPSEQLAEVLANAALSGVRRSICIGASNLTESAHQAVTIAEQFPTVWATVGIHPHDAGKGCSFAELEPLASHPKVRAIGETGLDFFRDWSPYEAQREIFRDQIALALNVRKPLVIHCREALEETLSILKQCNAREVGGVYHCYSGDEEYAKALQEINFIVSFPGSLTFKKSEELRRRAKLIPLEQIMLETDAPYMAPEPFRGGPSEPKHVYQIALKLAEVKGLPLSEVAKTTTANAERIFNLPPS